VPTGETLAECVQRAGADVSEDNADRSDDERPEWLSDERRRTRRDQTA
jgi:hypothetical protein